MHKRKLYKYFCVPILALMFALMPSVIKATTELPSGSKNIFVENVDINAVNDDGSITTGGLAAVNNGNASVVELINVTNNTSNHGILVANSNGTYTVINIVNDDGNNKVSNNDKLLLNNGKSSINGMFIANTIKNGNMSTVNGETFDKLEIYYPSDKSAVNTAKKLDFTPSPTIDVKAENLKTLNTAYNYWIDKGTNYYRLNKNGYVIDTFNINWDLNGGSVSGNPSTYTLGIGLSTLPTPYKRGYDFLGWKMNGGDIVTSIHRETVGDVTLEAQWQLHIYNINYELNGGTNPPDQHKKFTVEDEDYTLLDPSKTGYIFEGWFTKSDFSDTRVYKIPAGSVDDRTFYAKWKAVTYTVEYNGNGATSGSMSNSSHTYDVEKELTPNGYKRQYTVTYNHNYSGSTNTSVSVAYTFDGWSNVANASVVYADKAVVKNLTNVDSATVTLYAHWTSHSLNLRTPTRRGYTFAGWYKESACTNKVGDANAAYTPTANITLYAKWVPLTYTVTYNGNTSTSGSMSNSVFTYDQAATIKTNTYVKTGYEYKGWSTKTDHTDDGYGWTNWSGTWTFINGDKGIANQVLNLYARWNVVKYNITWELNGGTLSSTPKDTYTVETEDYTLPTPSRTGYSFDGWYTKSDFSGSAVTSIPKGSTGNKTFYAKWTPIVYSISYNLNGGTISNQKTSYTIETENFTLPTPTRTGYTFVGWTGTGLSSATKTVTINKGSYGNRTYTATWKANQYTYNIKYVSSSGKDLGGTTVTKDFDTTNTITAPAKNGYTTPASQSVAWDSVTAKTITFTYPIITYNITYNLNGGSVTGNQTTYNVETPTFTLKNPTKTGYTFNGWTGSNGSSNSTNVSITVGSYGDKSYTANFGVNPYTYTVKYVSSSGKDLGSTTVTHDYGTTNKITAPDKAGYTTPAAQDVKWDVAANTKVITFTYTLNTYTISYTLNGGSVTGNPTSYTVESAAITIKNPSRTGYTFTGWTGTGLSSASTSVSIPAGSTGNKSYTANWSANSYTYNIVYKSSTGKSLGSTTATFEFDTTNTISAPAKAGYTTPASQDIKWDSTSAKTITFTYPIITYSIGYTLNGGSVATANPTSYTVESSAITLNNPTRSGYNFGGWTGTGLSAATNTVTISAGSTGNKTYTANWNIITYSITYTLNGGSVATANPTSYTVETATFTLNNPTKTGYTFTGWTESNGTTANKSVSIAKGTTGNKTYTANYTANKYNIAYTLNGGTKGTNAPTSATYDGTVTINNPSRTGYTFAGWTFDGNTSTAMYGSSSTVISTKWSSQSTKVTSQYFKNLNPANGSTVTLTANWSAHGYTVKYDGNGATDGSTASSTHTYDVAKTLTANGFTRTGYTFTGWNTKADGTGTSYANQASVTNLTATNGATVTLYAQWSINTYNISWNLNSGTQAAGQKTSYNVTDSFNFLSPTRAGYTFGGWYSESSLTNKVTGITAGTTGDKAYWAKWTANTYTVVYNGNGATGGSTASSSHTYDTAKNLTTNGFTRTGYTFAGWATSASGSVAYANGASVNNLTSTANGTYNLYAKWSTVAYTISYDLAGGTVSPTNPTSYTIETATFTLNNPTKTGHTFKGWTGSNGTTANKSISVAKGTTGNKTYTANWTVNNYTYNIEYRDKNTNALLGSSTITKAYGSTNIVSPTTLDGYISPDSQNIVWDSETPKTIVFLFTPMQYTIKYNANGGQGNIPSQSFDFNTSVSIVSHSAINYPGYMFRQWSTNNTSSDEYGWTNWSGVWTFVNGNKGILNNTLSLYALWAPNPYIISYNGNGATSGSMTDLNCIYDEEVLLSTNNYLRTGYSFNGWNTKADGTGTGYVDKASAKNLTTEAGGKAILYAQWKEISYPITYNLDGGKIDVTYLNSYTINSETIKLPEPTKDGYDFAGWTGSNGSEPQKSVTIAKGSTGSRTYTANWVQKEFTIYFFGTGEGLNRSSYTYKITDGLTYNDVLPTNIAGDNYRIYGWYKDSNHTEQINFNELLPGKDSTIYPLWLMKSDNYTFDSCSSAYGCVEKDKFYAQYHCVTDKVVYYLEKEKLSTPVTKTYSWTMSCSAYSSQGTCNNDSSLNNFVEYSGLIKSESAGFLKMNCTYEYGKRCRKKIDKSYSGTITINYVDTFEEVRPSCSKNQYPEYVNGGVKTRPAYYPWVIYEGFTGDLTDYTITYNLDGGNLEEAIYSFNIASVSYTIPAPTKEGYTFIGWTGSNGSEPQMSVTIPHGSTGNRQYNANWEENTITINFYFNNNNSLTLNYYSYSYKYTEATYLTYKDIIPTSTGSSDFKIDHWTYDKNYTNVINLNDNVPKKDSTIYPLWLKKTAEYSENMDINCGEYGCYSGPDNVQKVRVSCAVEKTEKTCTEKTYTVESVIKSCGAPNPLSVNRSCDTYSGVPAENILVSFTSKTSAGMTFYTLNCKNVCYTTCKTITTYEEKDSKWENIDPASACSSYNGYKTINGYKYVVWKKAV